jgi:hypothetical protein
MKEHASSNINIPPYEISLVGMGDNKDGKTQKREEKVGYNKY